ncbi:hypothetical protein NMY22_g12494 [Coprinellus aureogranulatus]|nr:hypothetical protein NMY22_g12494 [Coprinellus aureogranulatus]
MTCTNLKSAAFNPSSIMSAPAQGGIWTEHRNPEGRTYWFNTGTKQSVWEKPDELKTPFERALNQTKWKEYFSGGRKYYYNVETKESKWDMPDELLLLLEKVEKDGGVAKTPAAPNAITAPPSKWSVHTRPTSDTPPSKPSNSRPSTVTTPTKPRPSKVSLPQTPPKKISSTPSSSSTPATPSGKAGQVQCSGTTKAGKRCTRMVKTAAALDEQIEDGEDGELNPPLERFCFQHTKELLDPSGYFSSKTGAFVDFHTWIPGYLQTETQAALRIEMERPRSRSDVDGYIYTFEIRDDSTQSVKLKVGRAVNLVKRIDEWSKQCGSKEQFLRGYYPGPEVLGEEGEKNATLMKGRVKAGEKAPCCHRLGRLPIPPVAIILSSPNSPAERLIHLELADLAATCAYLHPSWPRIDKPVPPVDGKKAAKRERCQDCGTMHKEIFEFQRWPEGSENEHKEWEKVVKPVVERWGMFVDVYV